MKLHVTLTVRSDRTIIATTGIVVSGFTRPDLRQYWLNFVGPRGEIWDEK